MAPARARSSSRSRATAAAAAAPNITISGGGLDNFIPTVRNVKEADLKARFKLQELTPIDGEPTFASVARLEQELASNALTIKVSFGGGKKGSLGLVFSATKYFAEAGQDWIVPVSEGAFPLFTAGMTDNQKKDRISDYLVNEFDLKVVAATGELLKNQFLEAVPEEYILELRQGLSE